jgi:hypothetical protein
VSQPRARKILGRLEEDPAPMPASDIEKILGGGERFFSRFVAILISHGLVTRHGYGNDAHLSITDSGLRALDTANGSPT